MAYQDSHDIDNIHIAGNHFIVECDSKFMTFGKIKNCVIEDNIIELKCTYSTWSIGLESNTYVDEKDVLVKHNDIVVTSDEGRGKGNLLSGNITFDSNRVFADQEMPFGIQGSRLINNEIICLKQIGYVSANANCIGNNITVYRGFGNYGGASNNQAALLGGKSEEDTAEYEFCNNVIYNFQRSDTSANFQSLLRIGNSNFGKLTVSDNRYFAPNVRYTKASNP